MMTNPYWDTVRDYVRPPEVPWEGRTVGRLFGRCDEYGRRLELTDEEFAAIPDRNKLVARYAWTITDPDSVGFVASHVRNGLVDPMAGTGYWAFLLGQCGIDVVSYDASPKDNPWHQKHPLWAPVAQGYGEVVIDNHPDRTLLLAWPPYSEPGGFRTVREYKGSRIIYIGEGSGGCTGDDDLHELLDDQWREVDVHTPVQWWAIHDQITVYQRKRWSKLRPLSAGCPG